MSKLKRVRITDLQEKKRRREKISMLTAYDSTMARIMDRAGIDVLLVGDSLGMVVMGHETTLSVTLDVMIHHTKAVSNGARRALVVADMPFLTYQMSVEESVRNAGRLMQEGGAAAVKLEGGRAVIDSVRRLVEIGIPVMGHLGLLPQSVHQMGGYRPAGRTQAEVEKLLEDSRLLQDAGVFAVVLEMVPADIAEMITEQLSIPTIGIGSGPFCDGQVLVSYDALGLFDAFVPSFVKQYAKLGAAIENAVQEYITDVHEGRFPGAEHSIGAKTAKSAEKE